MSQFTIVTIKVSGEPAPQGSKRHVGGGRMIEASKKLPPWREAVRAEVQRTMVERGLVPLEGPVICKVHFFLPRPQGHFGKRGLLPSAPSFPWKKPDVDKLARAVLDGAKAGGVYRDDAQVIDLHVRKDYADGPMAPGAIISVSGVLDG